MKVIKRMFGSPSEPNKVMCLLACGHVALLDSAVKVGTETHCLVAARGGPCLGPAKATKKKVRARGMDK